MAFLHVFFEILDAHAQPVEAHLAQKFPGAGARGHAGIDFDADFRVGAAKVEAFLRVREQIFQSAPAKDTFRCAAAPVELRDLAIARNPVTGDVVDLFFRRTLRYGGVTLLSLRIITLHAQEQSTSFRKSGRCMYSETGLRLQLRRLALRLRSHSGHRCGSTPGPWNITWS